MKINNVFSVRKDIDDALIFDLDFSFKYLSGGVKSIRSLNAYRASDTHSPLTPLITQWLSDNPDAEILPYIHLPEPTPEELRALMLPISKRQLRLTLVRNDISLSELDTAINSMGDEAIIEWNDSSEYRRLNPLLNQVAAHLSLSPEQVDAMWQQALSA